MSLYVDISKDLGSFRLSAQFEAENDVTGILGASGCGKSMTLKCIAGIMKPDRGRIVLNETVLFDSEKKISLPPQKRHIGLLFQNYALFPHMTVEKNLMTARRTVERDEKKARKAVGEMIERFYLTGLENHRPDQLSGGQQQRTALARILLTNPRLLMLDEPFSALDGYLRWNLELELMDILKEFENTVLFVSHSRDEIYRLCDKACVMDQGKSTPVVPVKTMFEEPETLAACMLSGCKNYSQAQPGWDPDGGEVRKRWVYAKDWGVRLECRHGVSGDIAYIGVRSHYIHILSDREEERPNMFSCRILRIVEDVFNMEIMVTPLNPGSDSARLRLEMPKEEWRTYANGEKGNGGDIIRVWIAPHDILLLRE